MNNVTLLGRIGQEPIIRQTNSGKTVANFSVATRSGGASTDPDWHSIVCWDKTAMLVRDHLGKGDMIGIEGRLQTRTWEKDGHKHKQTEVICHRIHFTGKGGSQQPTQGGSFDPNRGQRNPTQHQDLPAGARPQGQADGGFFANDNDIPF